MKLCELMEKKFGNEYGIMDPVKIGDVESATQTINGQPAAAYQHDVRHNRPTQVQCYFSKEDHNETPGCTVLGRYQS
jgi:hypothetical protein